MTVRELIELLQLFDGQAVVIIAPLIRTTELSSVTTNEDGEVELS
jgi:hypothetical protein